MVGTNRSAAQFQWRHNGIDIPGANADVYTIQSVQGSHAGDYDVVVSDICGTVISETATVAVDVFPFIRSQPMDQLVCLGEPAEFFVEADGLMLRYQWRKNGIAVMFPVVWLDTLPKIAVCCAG